MRPAGRSGTVTSAKRTGVGNVKVRFLSARTVVFASLVCFMLSSLAFAQYQPSSKDIVNLVIDVPTYVELELSTDTVVISDWELVPSKDFVESSLRGYRPSKYPALAGSALIPEHVTVYANVSNWTLTPTFENDTFTKDGGLLIIKLASAKSGSLSGTGEVVITSDSATGYPYVAQGTGKGITTFDAVYAAIAPIESDVEPSQPYYVTVTYTVTAD